MEDAAASLVDAALFVGAHDNVTVVVVAVRSDEESDEADGENTETSGETPT